MEKITTLKQVSLFLMLLILSACNKTVERRTSFYAIDSLLRAQAEELRIRKASLHKIAVLGTVEEKSSFQPDSAQWAKELEVFRQLKAINKPVNERLYRIEDGLPDSKSNLKVRLFKATVDLPVEYLKIFYQDEVKNVRRIEGKLKESNAMYKSTRIMVMEFIDVRNKSLLTGYSIEGGQKMILGDSVTFRVSGSVSLSD